MGARDLDRIIAMVRRTRPVLLDAWETAALIESFGYTDARIQREFAVENSLELGRLVFESPWRPRGLPAPIDVGPSDAESRAAALGSSLVSSLVYAAPWVATFAVELWAPDALRLPGGTGPALTLALMLSLVVSGGFVQAIARRGQFYLGIEQPALAAAMSGYLFRIGLAVAVTSAAIGIAGGWYFGLFPWPHLVIAADEFVVLTALWMACGVLMLRRDRWRIPAVFAAAAIVFVAMRWTRVDALSAEFVASGTALAIALAQIPSVFGGVLLDDVPLPRFTVVAYRILPFFWYGCAYFCFLFADRFAASAAVAALTAAPFSLRADYKFGMDVALLTFLLASAGIEYSNLRFTQAIRALAREAFDGNIAALGRTVRQRHARAAGTVVLFFAPIAGGLIFAATRLFPDQPRVVWRLLAVGDIGYLLLAVGLLNALVLFTLDRPWLAVRAVTAGLAVNLGVGYALSHVFDTYFAVVGLIAGAAVLALSSAIAVSRTTRRADYAIAMV